MEIKPTDLSSEQLYKVTMTSFIPRPISWISTVSTDGVNNLAPYALSSVVCTDPVIFQFSARHETDSWRNAQEQGSFVVNMTRVDMKPLVAQSSEKFPPDVDEFVECGLTALPSTVVDAPRLKEAFISFECKTIDNIIVGTSRMTLGELQYIHINDDVIADDGLIDAAKLDPLAKLGRREWSGLKFV